MTIRPDTHADPVVDALVLDLVEWIAAAARPYGEVMEAWRTSCPRLPVWEEALSRRLVIRRGDGMVGVTAVGAAYLRDRGRLSPR